MPRARNGAIRASSESTRVPSKSKTAIGGLVTGVPADAEGEATEVAEVPTVDETPGDEPVAAPEAGPPADEPVEVSQAPAVDETPEPDAGTPEPAEEAPEPVAEAPEPPAETTPEADEQPDTTEEAAAEAAADAGVPAPVLEDGSTPDAVEAAAPDESETPAP
jgi:hypothetical protein